MRTLLVLALLTGCGGSPATDPAPELVAEPDDEAPTESPDDDLAPVERVADPLIDADDFLFQWARSGGPAFIDEVSLRADGQLIWVRAPTVGGRPHALETRATPEEVTAVRQALARARYFALDPSYREPDVMDGSQLILRVRAGGQTHRVSCDNRFPDEVRAIRSAVEALLTPAREAALSAAPEAAPEDFDPSLQVE
ncbi:MAG: hypothetical protein KC619_27490 [Myxococcales bacterium]|nr:hypothetical protein [Myxococcales bacterium]